METKRTINLKVLLKPKYLSFLLIGIAVLVLPITIYLVNNTQDTRSGASVDKPEMLLNPTTLSVNKEDIFTVDVIMNTQSQSISGYKIYISYPLTVRLVSYAPSAKLDGAQSSIREPKGSQNSSENQKKEGGIGIMDVSSKPTIVLAGKIVLGTLTFQALDSGNATIKFGSQKVSEDVFTTNQFSNNKSLVEFDTLSQSIITIESIPTIKPSAITITPISSPDPIYQAIVGCLAGKCPLKQFKIADLNKDKKVNKQDLQIYKNNHPNP